MIVSNTWQASASSRKIPCKKAKTDEHSQDSESSLEESSLSGYRFVDMAILSFVFSNMPCKYCLQCDIILHEQAVKRKGCASNLRFLCCKCGWTMEFYTSNQIGRFFEVNRRFVYATRSIGCGRAASKRFCGLMNMLPPPQVTKA